MLSQLDVIVLIRVVPVECHFITSDQVLLVTGCWLMIGKAWQDVNGLGEDWGCEAGMGSARQGMRK